MPDVTALEPKSARAGDGAAPKSKEGVKPRFAPPSRRPFEGFGNALTTAVEIVVVTALGYFFGQRIGGGLGGALGMLLGSAASFVRLYYKVGNFESPLGRIKESSSEQDAEID